VLLCDGHGDRFQTALRMNNKLHMNNKPSPSQGSSDESIGRAQQWREGRYQRAGKPVDQAVNAPDKNDKGIVIVSTPVTREDYEKLTPE